MFVIRQVRIGPETASYKDVKNENSAGGTYCCGIIRKCINKRINWASKSLFIFPIKYITRKSMDSVFPEQGYEI